MALGILRKNGFPSQKFKYDTAHDTELKYSNSVGTWYISTQYEDIEETISMCNITVQIWHLEICIHSSINEYMVIFELFRIYFQKGWVITSCYDVVDTLFDDAPLLTFQICTIVN